MITLAEWEDRRSLLTKNRPCSKMAVILKMFIVSTSNIAGTLGIHNGFRKMIHDPIGLRDHVLIISQKLSIFYFFIFLKFIGYGYHG